MVLLDAALCHLGNDKIFQKRYKATPIKTTYFLKLRYDVVHNIDLITLLC